MGDDQLRLRPLRTSDEAACLQAHAELAADGFQFLLGWDEDTAWDGYVESKRAHARGEALPPQWVANTFLLAELDGAVVGRVSIRHDLNEALLREGGHIGLGVRPDFRGRGIGTAMLRDALVVARSLGIERALVTCDDDNRASASMIERAGGRLEDKVEPEGGGVLVRRYWVDHPRTRDHEPRSPS